LLEELDAQPRDPLPAGEHSFSNLSRETVHVRDPAGSYPVRALLCHTSFWKIAVDMLLERADVVAIDLSGYHWENLGTAYELQRVVDRFFPIHRCVVLAAPNTSDRHFLEAQVQQAWRRMAGGSPNAGEGARDVLVAHPDFMEQFWPDMQVGRGLALATLLQARLDRAGEA
jgi:hypothetical protein